MLAVTAVFVAISTAQAPSPGPGWKRATMNARNDDLHIRPGRIRPGTRGARRPASFVAEVLRAAKKAGQIGDRFGAGKFGRGRSRFGRGRRAAASLSLSATARRVVTKARVVRHRGSGFRAAPLARHIGYLRRDGVTRDGADARMFDARSDDADSRAFAERCAEDRHHFRFIVSPEDAAALASLRDFTRELMQDAERDLGTRLDWIAVDHWNTDNPHIHLLIRGRADDGRDLVISRDYISRGLRDRAAARITLELGPRSAQDIRAGLEKEITAERWTSLDRALRDIADESAGIADLRPGAGEDPDLRRRLIGRATRLERFGLAEQVGPAQWLIKPGLEPALRDLDRRGDIIKTMHRAMRGGDREPDVAGFALHGEQPSDPILGRLVERGLHDELKGTAYAVIDGIDGRTHHVVFPDLALTGDAMPGAIVEARLYDDAAGERRVVLATRSDLSLAAQVTAPGATWLDRQLLTKEATLSAAGFGADVRAAMEKRIDHLADQNLARRHGQRVIFARDLLATLRRRELDAAAARLSAETGLRHRPSAEGEHVSGVFRRRVTLASGRFAMIEDGLGFQLVPWRPALEKELGHQVGGVMGPGGRVDWGLGRKQGFGMAR
jgi:type IV secretory pathway VirD2 relaxase